MVNIKRAFTAMLLALSAVSVVAQVPKDSGQISGRVILEEQGLAGITVFLKDTYIGDVSDSDGYFRLNGIVPGVYTLVLSGLGYERYEQELRIAAGEVIRFSHEMKPATLYMEQVTVMGKSEATEVREQAYAVEVIETRGFKNLSSNANDILRKVSGVNIRQSGGVGSDFTLSLNGLTGNQVRIFLDGIPMDYFGSSLTLNNFSANLIERMEVYKGVVPIHLSSDALGGAINVVTGNQYGNFLDASYSHGSFGTNIASLNGQWREQSSGYTVRLKSFYNYSDNNYPVPIRLVNFETGKEDPVPTQVRRFHDAYQSRMAWLETGFTNVPFADQLMVGLLYSDNFDEIQQPANAIGEAKIPFGQVISNEQKVISNLSYRKNGVITDGLNVNSYFVAAFSQSTTIDTSSFDHDWFGNQVVRLDRSAGEVENRKTFLTLDTDNYLGNVNAEYQVSQEHNFAVNYSLNSLTLQGSDSFKDQNNTQFSEPNHVVRQVSGFSYTTMIFDGRIKTTVFSKYYDYRIRSLTTDYMGEERTPFRNHKDRFGFGISGTFELDQFQFKASFENATRFPEIIELFGDGLNIVPSPGLLPERSNNYNLGVLFSDQSEYHSAQISLNGFVRDAGDFIIPLVSGIRVTHVNNGMVLSKGVDLAFSYEHRDNWMFSLSGTYLDLRDNNRWRNGSQGVPNRLYGVRIPNVPYLFGNAAISYQKPSLINQDDSFSATLTTNYVHEFFFRWENLGSRDKGMVPSQLTNDLELVYSFKTGRYNLSAVIANLWDSEVYDNFQQLRPGRTINIKLRYLLK